MRLLLKVLLVVGGTTGGLHVALAEGGALTKGVGPVQEQKLDPLDLQLATQGKEIFINKCSACHKLGERYVGPALKDTTKRRTPEWIMNMILNPQEMTQKDPTAQALLEEYLMQMPFQNVSTAEARAILEYFRHYDEKGEIAAPADTSAKGGKSKASKKQPVKNKS
jgi:mono/diheme cytochrome c family protein